MKVMIHKLASRKANVCVVIAVLMALLAVSYVLWALLAPHRAKTFWAPYAVVEAVLAIWNLLVYYERSRITKARRAGRADGGEPTTSR